MEVVFLILVCLLFAAGEENQSELKVDYFEEIIKDAFREMKSYKGRYDNSDYLKDVRDDKIEDYGTFDYVVVGAGSSGSAVSSRLSENEKFKVLLLEAGDWDDDLSRITYMSNILQYSERNWGYFTVPQKNGCYVSKDNRCPYARGKIVGGTGAIGYADFVRGNKADYDNWESLGNPGWSSDDVLPLFKKLENFESDDINLEYRGFGGPVNVGYTIPKQDFSIINDSFSEIGVNYIEDYNIKQEFSVSRIQKSTKCGEKQSGATSYVRPAYSRHNFNVTVKAFVTKILIEDKRACGVYFVKNGKMYKATANEEIILSAGTINSAQILMLSGIGPKEELSKHGIPVIVDSPVGKHVKDSVVIPLRYETNANYSPRAFREYIRDYLNGENLLTNFENVIAISFFNSRNASSFVPNIELLDYFPSAICKSIPPMANFTDEGEKYIKKIDLLKDIYVNIFALHPKSSGSITLQSKDPIDFPLIDNGIFTDPDDIEVLYEGIQIVVKTSKTKAGQRVAPKHVEFETCSNKYGHETREYWICLIKYLGHGGFGLSSSAKMGPKTDPLAVVDNNLRVYGVDSLRVADCSIMPTTVSGPANAAAFMIGEKLANLIFKKDSETFKN